MTQDFPLPYRMAAGRREKGQKEAGLVPIQGISIERRTTNTDNINPVDQKAAQAQEHLSEVRLRLSSRQPIEAAMA